jgi:hypothetical protein
MRSQYVEGETMTTESKRLYEEDYYAWLEHSIQQVKELGLTEIQDHLEEMTRSEKRELRSRFIVLIQHLLKWKYQPKKRKTGWKLSINNNRTEINFRLKDSPSLKPQAYSLALEAYPAAVENAKAETGLTNFPAELEFTLDQLLDQNFFPPP